MAVDCRHCGRTIVKENGVWIDPEATGDDAVWRETCDSHDTFVADHEPVEIDCPDCGETERRAGGTECVNCGHVFPEP